MEATYAKDRSKKHDTVIQDDVQVINLKSFILITVTIDGSNDLCEPNYKIFLCHFPSVPSSA